MSLQSINTALTGLKAAQQAINVASNNIANASTPGYTRKILPQEANFAGDQSFGVRINAIVRNVDQNLIRSLIGQNSTVESLTVREEYLARIQEFHGPAEAESSIGAVLSNLKDDFIKLASEPESNILLGAVVDSAQNTANQFNRFSNLLQELRNNAQRDISASIQETNAALEEIADINRKIIRLPAAGISPADLEDRRDVALQTVAKNLDVTFFEADNNKIYVLTKTGHTLADENARQLVFQPTRVDANNFYPGGGSEGIYIDSTSGVELTGTPLSGRIGQLITLRDETLTQYQAQLDELAQKTAERFADQGLALFTDAVGNVPPSVAPPGLVSYSGFAGEIRVNSAVVNDNTLVRSGTTGATVPVGSTEIIRKVIDFTFGDFSSEQAVGTVDISGGTIYANAGLSQFARVIGTTNIAQFTALEDDPNITAGNQFTIDTGSGPQLITINAADTATDLVNNINLALPGTARLNGLGQLVLENTADITIADISMGAAGLSALGLSTGTTTATDPSFTIQSGINNPVTIPIAPGDTSVELLAALNAVPNISASLGGSGELIINATQGGDITFADGQGNPIQALGVTVTGIPHTAFRQDNLGPNAATSTELINYTGLVKYAQGMIALQGEVHNDTQVKLENEKIFFNTLETRFSNDSGVDIDQEVAKLIHLQTAYSANARAISISEQLFNTLLEIAR